MAGLFIRNYMKLIQPTAITDAILTSSNVAETDYAAWNSSTAYTVGQKVIVIATHKIYECLINNTNKYPPDYVDTTSPEWLDLGATNRWKMFDQSYYNQTSNTGSIVIVMAPGRINSLGIMNVEGASSITVGMMVDAVSVYSATANMIMGNVNDWYEYFYNPIERRSDFVFTDLPVYSNGILTITISGGIADTIKCGLCIPGFFVQIGESLWGAKVGVLNYSTKDQDVFGNYTIVKRKYSKTLSDSIFVANGRTGYLQKLIQPYYSEPALWVASEEFEATIIYGFYRDFSIVLEDYSGSQCSLEIEGLT